MVVLRIIQPFFNLTNQLNFEWFSWSHHNCWETNCAGLFNYTHTHYVHRTLLWPQWNYDFSHSICALCPFVIAVLRRYHNEYYNGIVFMHECLIIEYLNGDNFLLIHRVVLLIWIRININVLWFQVERISLHIMLFSSPTVTCAFSTCIIFVLTPFLLFRLENFRKFDQLLTQAKKWSDTLHGIYNQTECKVHATFLNGKHLAILNPQFFILSLTYLVRCNFVGEFPI